MFEATQNQIRHWDHYQRWPDSAALNVTAALLLDGQIDGRALQFAAGMALRRHGMPGCSARLLVNGLCWQPCDGGASADLPAIVAVDPDHLLALMAAEVASPFQLEQGAAARVRLLSLGPHRMVVLISMHHIVCDGWSMDLLIREIAQLYEMQCAAAQGEASLLASDAGIASIAAAGSYPAFARYQNEFASTPHGLSDRQYWQTQLQGVRMGSCFPAERRPSAAATGSASTAPGASSLAPAQTCWAGLPQSLSAAVRAAAAAHGVTPFAVLAAAFGRLISLASGEPDVLIGVPFSNRVRPADARLVGLVANILPLRLREPGRAAKPYLASVADTVREAFLHQRLPYCPGQGGDTGSPPLHTLFILQSSASARVRFADLDARQAWVANCHADYDQTWSVEQRGECYTLDVKWDCTRHSEMGVKDLMEQYCGLLHALLADLSEPAEAQENAGPVVRQRAVSRPGLRWHVQGGFETLFSGPVLPAPRPAVVGVTAHCG